IAPASAAASAVRWTRRLLAQYQDTSTTIATMPSRATIAPAKITRTWPVWRAVRRFVRGIAVAGWSVLVEGCARVNFRLDSLGARRLGLPSGQGQGTTKWTGLPRTL